MSSSSAARRKTRDALDRSGGLVYRTGVFTLDEYQIIADEAASWRTLLQQETTSSVAQHRLGVALPPTSSPTVKLLQNPRNSLTALVQKLTSCGNGDDDDDHDDDNETCRYQLAPHIPVEIRSYEKPGAGMAWHVDDVLCDPPQIEVVWTLENTSDCVTLWRKDDARPNDGVIHSRETDRNSALLLRAGQTPHCVTSLKRAGGRRVILKCAYATANASHWNNSNNNKPQFGTTKKAKAPCKKKRKRRKR